MNELDVSTAATPAVAAGNRVSTTRIVGATAIAVAALVLIDNVVVGWLGSPPYGATLKEVLAFHADHRAAVAVAVGLEALATHASRLTPPWQRLLAAAGGSLLLVAGVGNLAIADGSPLLFVGLPGFAAWLVWLVATGLRLMRTKADAVA